MKRRQISISMRLTMWFGSVFLFGWLLFGTSMWAILRSTLKAERYQTLARRLDRLQNVLSEDATAPEALRFQNFRDFARATGNGLSEVLYQDGSRAYPSPSASAQSFVWPQVTAADSGRLIHVLSGGQNYWVLVRSFRQRGIPLLLLVAAPDTSNLLLLANFWHGLLAWAPVILLVSCASGYWVSRKALGPVDRIAAKARSISIRNLSERLPVSETGDELQRLAVTCNAMLQRLESAVNQIKQFTADASHELRGPLSFTRTVAELALRNPATDVNSRKAFEDIVAQTTQAALLLEEMLALARADADPFCMVLAPVDLVHVLQDVRVMAEPIAENRGLVFTVEPSQSTSVPVLGDFASLRRLLWVMVDNALKYTPAAGRVSVSLIKNSDAAILRVLDTGIGISDADLPHIFSRFYRADPSRSMVEGNGLGLAIAKWISEIHGAQIHVASVQHSGTTFEIVFPAPEFIGTR